MVIKSFVGGHSVKVFRGCEYDDSSRKYRGGELIAEIPYSGRMLSATIRQSSAEPIDYLGAEIPTQTPQVFETVDPLPSEQECDYCIVSAMYVAACKQLGIDTSRLLTIGTPVVDADGRIIGACGLSRN